MSNEFRVLHIIDHLGLGGAQKVVLGFLSEEEDHIWVYSLRQTKYDPISYQNKVLEYKSQRRYSLLPLFSLRDFIIKKRIDILHCHLFRAQFFGWLIKKFFYSDVTLVFHEHGKILKNNFYIDQFIKWVKNDVDAFIAVSEFTKKELIQRGNVPQSKISVLYNFVDLNKYPQDKVSQDRGMGFEIPKNVFVIGFAGRLIPRKAWQDFLTAASSLREESQYLFIMAGSGKDKESLEQKISESNLTKYVKFLGYVKDMDQFYSMLDCLVIPSWWEAMGLILLEAMAMGVPVIAANAPALNELIVAEENGLLFEPKNPADLSRKIIQLKNDPELQERLIRTGFEYVKQFSLSNYHMELNTLYRSLL